MKIEILPDFDKILPIRVKEFLFFVSPGTNSQFLQGLREGQSRYCLVTGSRTWPAPVSRGILPLLPLSEVTPRSLSPKGHGAYDTSSRYVKCGGIGITWAFFRLCAAVARTRWTPWIRNDPNHVLSRRVPGSSPCRRPCDHDIVRATGERIRGSL